MNNSFKICAAIASGLCVATLLGCAAAVPMAMDTAGGMVIGAMGSLLDKPLEISEAIKKDSKIVFENAKWRQVTADEISVGFMLKYDQNCSSFTVQGDAYVGDTVIGNYMSTNVGRYKTGTKIVVSEKIYPKDKRYVDRVTVDSFTCYK